MLFQKLVLPIAVAVLGLSLNSRPVLAGRPVFHDLTFSETVRQAPWVFSVKRLEMPKSAVNEKCQMADRYFEINKVLAKPADAKTPPKRIFVRRHQWQIYYEAQKSENSMLPSFPAKRMRPFGEGIPIGKTGKILLGELVGDCGEYLADGSEFNGQEVGVSWPF